MVDLVAFMFCKTDDFCNNFYQQIIGTIKKISNKKISVYMYCFGLVLLLATVCAQGADSRNELPNYHSIFPDGYDGIISDVPNYEAETASSLHELESFDGSSDEAGPPPVLDESANLVNAIAAPALIGEVLIEEDEDIRELVGLIQKGATQEMYGEALLNAVRYDHAKHIPILIAGGVTKKQCSEALLEAVMCHDRAKYIPILIAAGATSDEALKDYLKIKNKVKIGKLGYPYYLKREDHNKFKRLYFNNDDRDELYPTYRLTLLSLAIRHQNKKTVEELLRCNGSKIEEVSLIQSMKGTGSYDILTLLINAQADVNEQIFREVYCAEARRGRWEPETRHNRKYLKYKKTRLTPLLLAIQNGRFGLAQLLIDAGAQISNPHLPHILRSCGKGNFSSDFEAVFKDGLEKNKRDVVRVALVAGVNVDLKYADGATPLLSEIRKINGSMITVLLDGKADVNKEYSGGETALLEATRRGNVEIAQQLLAANADVRVRNKKGETPMSIAKGTRNAAMVIALKAVAKK